MAVRLSRDEVLALVAGVLIVVLISFVDTALGPTVVLVGFLVVPVFLLSAFASPAATGIVGGLSTTAAVLLLTTADEGTVEVFRVIAVAVSSVVAVGIARLRTRREAIERERERQLSKTQVSADLGRRLRVALDAGRMGTWVWRVDSGRVTWDAQLEAIFGLAPGEYDGTFERWTEMLHPDDRDRVLSEVQAAMADGSDYIVEHRCIWPDGSVHWVEGRGEVLRDADGNVAGTTGVTVDVTDRKLAEHEAEETRRLTVEVLGLEELFDPEHSPDEVLCVACLESIRLFGCDSASVWTVEGMRAELVAREPTQESPRGLAVSLNELIGVQSELGSLRPGWLGPLHVAGLPPHSRGVLDQLGAVASLWVPTTSGGQANALLSLEWTSPVAQPSAERVQVIERFAGQVALAVAQAQRGAARDEAFQLTARLQAGLVPRTHWTYRGFDSAAVYRPGEDRLLLGGDFYDMLPHGDDSVTFVLGDVSGHGPEAAALGATLRAAWSSLARIGADPHTILTTLHDVVIARRPTEETFATVVVGTISSGQREARYSLAGHPPPIVLSSRARAVPAITGPPLGILDEPSQWPVRHLTLPDPGSLLLFTDGLVEGRAAPGSSERYGTERLLQRLNSLEPPWALDQPGLTEIVAEVVDANGGPLADDVAVLLVSPRANAHSAVSRADVESTDTQEGTGPG